MNAILHSKNVFFLLFCALVFLSCQSVQIDEGHKEWENMTLRATGFGGIDKNWSISERVQAIQKAKVDAYTQLEAKIMVLKTGSMTKVSDLVEEDDTLQKKIAAFVRGAKIVRTESNDQGLKVVTELFLGGSFKATLGLQNRPKSPSNLNRAGERPR